MRRKLLFLLFLPGIVLLPVTVYRKFVPQLSSGIRLEGTATVFVSAIAADSPGAEAGLRLGDRLVSIDGEPVSNPPVLRSVMFRSEPEASHKMEYERDGLRSQMTFRMKPPGPAGGRILVVLTSSLVSLLLLVTGLILWFGGKGSAVAEYAGAMFIFFGLDPVSLILFDESLGPLLKRYPLHAGEIAFVLLPTGIYSALGLLMALANNVPRPLVRSRGWNALVLALIGAAAWLSGLHLTYVLQGGMPDWLGSFIYRISL